MPRHPYLDDIFPGIFGNGQPTVNTWKALRDSRIAQQHLDYSCGAVSIVTAGLTEMRGWFRQDGIEAMNRPIPKAGWLRAVFLWRLGGRLFWSASRGRREFTFAVLVPRALCSACRDGPILVSNGLSRHCLRTEQRVTGPRVGLGLGETYGGAGAAIAGLVAIDGRFWGWLRRAL